VIYSPPNSAQPKFVDTQSQRTRGSDVEQLLWCVVDDAGVCNPHGYQDRERVTRLVCDHCLHITPGRPPPCTHTRKILAAAAVAVQPPAASIPAASEGTDKLSSDCSIQSQLMHTTPGRMRKARSRPWRPMPPAAPRPFRPAAVMASTSRSATVSRALPGSTERGSGGRWPPPAIWSSAARCVCWNSCQAADMQCVTQQMQPQ
jgi:hypothetical protein